jgi:amino acid transporter
VPSRVKNVLLGDPLHNEQTRHQRLSNAIALAVFSSDAISSVAYATGEIILMLSIAGAAFLHLTWPIALAIGVLLIIVATSYRQTIRAYPNGGGSYIVARENLGDIAGLIAGASLLVDYVLTVSVSIASGTAAITSAFPALLPWTVPICLLFVAILAVGNLRGVKESGALFSVPTYVFIGSAAFMVLFGLFTVATHGVQAIQVPSSHEAVSTVGVLSLFLILRAFASGCAAMTGVEAIANGVQAFREPVSKNAARTLTWMAGILLFLFLGITWLAVAGGVRNVDSETVISQISRQLFGTGFVYYLISFATTAILVVAANTSYADFPRLSSFMASDDFMPHQLKDRGYRLVHSNGILLLTGAAAGLIIAFRGNTSALIPLYAVGVFTAFTLSQAGMVRHWIRFRDDRRWRFSVVVNGIGAVTTAIVLLVIAITKFTSGAWIVLLLVPVMVAYFLWVRRRYDLVRAQLAVPEGRLVELNWQAYNQLHNHVLVLVKAIDQRLIRALQYAKSLRADTLEAVFVDVTSEGAEAFRREWDAADFGVKLTVIQSPYREVISPLLDYIRSFPRPTRDDVVTVILTEYVPANAADYLLHDQTSLWIKQQLFSEEGVIVADVPYHADSSVEIASRTVSALARRAIHSASESSGSKVASTPPAPTRRGSDTVTSFTPSTSPGAQTVRSEQRPATTVSTMREIAEPTP